MHYTADGRVISENNNLVEKPLSFNYETNNNNSNVSSIMNNSIFGNEDIIIELPKSNIVNTGYDNYVNLANFEDHSDAFVLSNISNNKFPYGLTLENTEISLKELQTNRITNIPFQNGKNLNVNQQQVSVAPIIQQVPIASASQPAPFAFVTQQSQFDFISQPVTFSQQEQVFPVSQQVPVASQPAPFAFVPQQSPFDFVFQPLLFSQQAPVISQYSQSISQQAPYVSQQAPYVSQYAPTFSQQVPSNLLPSAFLIQNEKTNLPISNNDLISLFSMENVVESSMERPTSSTELIPVFSMENVKSIVEIPNLPIIQSSENDFVEFPNTEQDLLDYEPDEDQDAAAISNQSYFSLESPYAVQSSYNAPSSNVVYESSQSSYNAPSSNVVYESSQSSYNAPSSNVVYESSQSSYNEPSSNVVYESSQLAYNEPSSEDVIDTLIQASLENLSEQELIDTLLKEGVSIDSLIPTASMEDIMEQDMISQSSEISDETLKLFQNQIDKLASMNI